MQNRVILLTCNTQKLNIWKLGKLMPWLSKYWWFFVICQTKTFCFFVIEFRMYYTIVHFGYDNLQVGKMYHPTVPMQPSTWLIRNTSLFNILNTFWLSKSSKKSQPYASNIPLHLKEEKIWYLVLQLVDPGHKKGFFLGHQRALLKCTMDASGLW